MTGDCACESSGEGKVSNMAVRISTMAIVLVVALALFGFVQAPTASAAAGQESYKGKVTFYDEAGKQMTVDGKDGVKPFFVGNAKIDGKIDLNKMVVVNYPGKIVNGENVASSVKVIGSVTAKNEAGQSYGESGMK